MKILFLARQLNIGGAERQLVTLANELANRGHEVVIASYYPGGALSNRLDSERVRLISFGKRSRWDLLHSYLALVRLVRKNDRRFCTAGCTRRMSLPRSPGCSIETSSFFGLCEAPSFSRSPWLPK